jgi:hypothetical protein
MMKLRTFFIAVCFLATGFFAAAQVAPIKWQNSFQTDTGRVIYEPSGAFDQIVPPNTNLIDIKPATGGGYLAIVNGRQALLVKISDTGDTLFTRKLTENSLKLAATADGGVVVLGYNSKSVHGISGITMCKYSSEGILIWREEYKGGKALSPTYAREEPVDLLTTPDGGYVILAISNLLKGNDKSADPIGPVSAGIAPDYWVIKTSAYGLPEWDKTIGGFATDEAASAINVEGGYIIAGTSNSPVSGNKTQPQKAIDHQNPSDIWLVKIDNAGNVLWDKTVGSDTHEYTPLMIAAKDGGFLVNCITYGGISGDKTEETFGSTDSWVIKFNGEGNIQWQKTLGGIYQEAPGSLLELPDDGFLITQTSNSPKSGNKTPEALAYDLDIWQVKLTATGAIEWQTVYGGIQGEKAPVVFQNTDGTIMMASSSNSSISGNKTVSTKSKIMFEGTEYNGGNDVWLVLFDVPTLPVNLLSFTGQANNGHALLQWRTATETNFSHFELEKSFDGQVYTKLARISAKGNTSKYNYTDDFNSGKSYYRLKMVDKDGSVKYSNVVVINAINYANVTIAPNPVTGNHQLVMSMAAAPVNAMCQIVGIDGRIYASQKVAAGSTQVTIDTKALVSGTYSLVYSQGNSRKVLRFVKQ